jgi:hypothetical protein
LKAVRFLKKDALPGECEECGDVQTFLKELKKSWIEAGTPMFVEEVLQLFAQWCPM